MNKLVGSRSELARGASSAYTPDTVTHELMMSAQTELTFLSDKLKEWGAELEEIKNGHRKAGKTSTSFNRKEELKKRIREAKLRKHRVIAESEMLASVDHCFVERIKKLIDPELFAKTKKRARLDHEFIKSNMSIPHELLDNAQEVKK